MKKFLLIALVALAAFACRSRARIPRGEMEEICYQMLLQDQYLKQHNELMKQADTSLVYAGIFEEFGYTTDEFLASFKYYVDDPARMEKITEKVTNRLEKELKKIDVQLEEENWKGGFMRIYSLKPDTTRLPRPTSPLDSLHVQFSKDSLFYLSRQ